MADQAEVFARLADLMPIAVNLIHWESPSDLGSFRFIWVNEAARQISGGAKGGFAYDFFLGKTLGEAFPELMDTPLPHLYAEAERTGVPQSLDRFIVPNPEGRDAYLNLQAVRVGERLLAVTYINVTDQVEVEARRDAALAELARSNEDLNQFAYVASHDLKAPLRDVDNLAQWIIEDLDDHVSEEILVHATTLRSRVGRMERLLDDLLTYARAGSARPASSDFCVDTLLADMVELVGAPQGFEVRLPAASGLRLVTPRAPLEVILRNLVSNAIKHHDKSSGLVEVTVVDDGGETIGFTVRDDGPGIPEKFQARIFEMFKTLQSRDQVEGTGMGLALVKKLVDRYGEGLRVHSQQGKRGASFSFRWPKRLTQVQLHTN